MSGHLPKPIANFLVLLILAIVLPVLGTVLLGVGLFVVVGGISLLVLWMMKQHRENKFHPFVVLTAEDIKKIDSEIVLGENDKIKLLPSLEIKDNELQILDNDKQYQKLFVKRTVENRNLVVDVLLMDLIYHKIISWESVQCKRFLTGDNKLKEIYRECIRNIGADYSHIMQLLIERSDISVHQGNFLLSPIRAIVGLLKHRNPVILHVERIGKGLDDVLLVIGFEMGENKKIKKLFCLSPTKELKNNTYWNAYIAIDNETNECKFMPDDISIKLSGWYSLKYSNDFIESMYELKKLQKLNNKYENRFTIGCLGILGIVVSIIICSIFDIISEKGLLILGGICLLFFIYSGVYSKRSDEIKELIKRDSDKYI